MVAIGDGGLIRSSLLVPREGQPPSRMKSESLEPPIWVELVRALFQTVPLPWPSLGLEPQEPGICGGDLQIVALVGPRCLDAHVRTVSGFNVDWIAR